MAVLHGVCRSRFRQSGRDEQTHHQAHNATEGDYRNDSRYEEIAAMVVQEPQTGPAKKWIILLVFAAAAAAALWLWMYRQGTYHFSEVQRGVLYRDGNRGLREFSTALRKGGIRTVVMLNDDDEVQKEPFKGELELLKQKGIEVVRIPVKLGSYPNSEQVQKFLEVTQ